MAGDLLYSEHFGKYKDGSGVAGGWWVEGGERVWIDGGRLRVKANPAKQEGSDHVCTVWNKQAFSGDLEVSFRTCVLDSTIKANNILGMGPIPIYCLFYIIFFNKKTPFSD